MGNRAVITHSTHSKAPAIYLHWNGGRASVEGFLQAAKTLQITLADDLSPTEARTQALDRLAGLIAKHFFKTEVGLSVYRLTYGESDKDNYDNGTYVISDSWDIVKRLYARGGEEVDPTKTEEICKTIVEAEQAQATQEAENAQQ